MATPILLQVGSRGTRSLAARQFAATRAVRITYCEDEDRWAGLPGGLAQDVRAALRAREPWLLSLGLKERVAYAGLLAATVLMRARFAERVLVLPLDWMSDPEEERADIGAHLPLEAGLAFAMIPDRAMPEWQAPATGSPAAWSVMDGPVVYASDPDVAAAFLGAVEALGLSRSTMDNCLERVMVEWVLQGRIHPFRQNLVVSAENLPSWREATRAQVAGAFVQPETPLVPFAFNRHELRPAKFVWQTPDFSSASGRQSHLRDRLRSAFNEKARIDDPGRGSADPISGAEQYMLCRYLGQAAANTGPRWKEDFVRWMLGANEFTEGPSRIESEIYRHRPDLPAAFPRQSGIMRKQLRDWFIRHGLAELGISLIGRSDLDTARLRRSAAGLVDGTNSTSYDVHVVGYIDAVLGLGIGARNNRDALAGAGVSVASTSIALPSALDVAPPPRAPVKCRVSLLFNNGDYMHVVSSLLDAESLKNSHRIGVWAWELPQVPPRMLQGLAYVDELWVASSFIREAFRPHTRKAITVVPYPVRADDAEVPGYDDLLPAEPYFFFAFDYNSTVERKNPAGLIEAFNAAFPEGSGPHLVIKTLNAGAHTESHERLLGAALQRKDIHLIDAVWPRALVHRALRNCLAVVSLHRAEGYGLLLAEAMAHGKPTIATGYSGNLEYQNPGNSLLVGYRMTQVSEECRHYEAGEAWAEPDLDEAARAMRAVFKGGRDIEALARAGEQTARERLSPEAVGRRMKNLLEVHLKGADGAASVFRQWRRWRAS
jgi:glycosyltransferase involved in cell wall biosynthesis